jgi:hypothetical protein
MTDQETERRLLVSRARELAAEKFAPRTMTER